MSRSISASVRCSRLRNSAFGRLPGGTGCTIRFTVAGATSFRWDFAIGYSVRQCSTAAGPRSMAIPVGCLLAPSGSRFLARSRGTLRPDPFQQHAVLDDRFELTWTFAPAPAPVVVELRLSADTTLLPLLF